MADRDPFDLPGDRNDDDPNPLAEFMAQFGIRPGPDGTFDVEQLMGHLQQAMAQFQAHMQSFGGGADGGLNWAFTKDIARKVTAGAGPDPSPTAADVAAVRELWTEVARQVLDQGLRLGVHADMPMMKRR